MDALHLWELPLIVWLQSLGAWLTSPMEWLSFLGTENFYLLFMPILYWCISPVLGLRVGAAMLVSNALVDVFKVAFQAPRPYWLTSEAHGLAAESSFGFPSGHASNAAAVWGMVAAKGRIGWVRAAAVTLIVLIGVSRLYLGVHFLSDVLGGWLLGLTLLALMIRLERPVMRRVLRQNLARQILLAFAASVAILIINILPRLLMSGYVVPSLWTANASAVLDPLDFSGAVTIAGLALGLLAGAAWLFKRGGFVAAGKWNQLILRYLIGLAGVLLIWYGLRALLPYNNEPIGLIARYLRYTLLGGWVSAGAPWVFMRLKLADSGREAEIARRRHASRRVQRAAL